MYGRFLAVSVVAGSLQVVVCVDFVELSCHVQREGNTFSVMGPMKLFSSQALLL